MGLHAQKEWLQWQLTETKELLAMSKGSPLMSISLENRIAEIQSQLEELAKMDIKEAKMSLLFSGKAVFGSQGIKSTFASKAMNSIQGMIKTQLLRNIFGDEAIGKRGKLSRHKMGEMYLTNLPQGSFGFELTLMDNEDMFAEEYAADSILTIMDVIEATAKDQNKYEELVATYPDRMLTLLKDFFKELNKENSILKMESGNKYIELTKDETSIGFNRVSTTINEERTITLQGTFKGTWVHSGKFEFIDYDGEIYHGFISEDFQEDMLVYFNKKYSNARCKVTLLKRITTFNGSREKISYELLNIEE